MNYRHAYHAGNFADVHKHVVLLALLNALKAKPTPFAVIESHAGGGSYELDGVEANKTNEYKDGVSRLLFPDLGKTGSTGAVLPALLRRWLDAIVAMPQNADGLKLYPGSPMQIAAALRPQDSAQLCELQMTEADRLRQLLHNDPRMHVHQRDGYEAIKALLPPPEKRGLVLIDPPYEAQEAEYATIQAALKLTLQRWPTGMFAVWYPIKLRSQVQPFLRWLARCGARRVLQTELLVYPDDSALRLNGSGMAVINAPWKLDDVLREPMRAMAQHLSRENHATWNLRWLVSEDTPADALTARFQTPRSSTPR